MENSTWQSPEYKNRRQGNWKKYLAIAASVIGFTGVIVGAKIAEGVGEQNLRSDLQEKAGQIIPGYDHIVSVDRFPVRLKAGEQIGEATVALEGGKICNLRFDKDGNDFIAQHVVISDIGNCPKVQQ